MFTVKFLKYGPHSTDKPTPIERAVMREAGAVHVCKDEQGRRVLQLGDAPNETQEFTVGMDRTDCSYDIAYIMNSTGKTVETVS